MKLLRKKRLFRIAAATLVPLLLLGALELALRVAGFGHPSSFFLKTERDGKVFRVGNERFTWLFFPPPLARGPLPFAVAEPKPKGTYRIFVLGGSAAKGEPEPAFGFARILEVLLDARLAGREILDFEVINLGVTAINSHVVLRIASEIAGLEGDLWVLYMGNNEVMGPFGARSIFGARVPPLALARASVAVKSTKLGQALDRILDRVRGRSAATDSWQGMGMFLEQRIRRDDPSLARVHDSFRRNLEDIIAIAAESHSKLIACTLVSNLKDCAPFSSLHAASLSEADREAWEELFLEGSRLEAEKSIPRARDCYRRAMALDPEYAELHFRLGRCSWILGRMDDAKLHYTLARDLDALRFRPDTRTCEIIREVAGRRSEDGIHLLDAEQIVAGESPHGIPGEEYLYEHVHLNYHGNYLLAMSLAAQIEGILYPGGAPAGAREWLSVDEVARRLALTPWDLYRVLSMMLGRLREPLYTQQSNHDERLRRIELHVEQLGREMRKAGFEGQAEVYRQALREAPGDWVLREQYGAFLSAAERYEPAREELRRVVAAVPNDVPARYKLGMIEYHLKQYSEAQACFAEAVRSSPFFSDAHHYLGLAMAAQGRHEAACEHFARACRVGSASAKVHVSWGTSLDALDRKDEALEHFAEALRLDPQNQRASAYLETAGASSSADGEGEER